MFFTARLSRSSSLSMNYNKNFDANAVLRTVEAMNKHHPEGTPEDEALRVCAAALLFIRDDLQKLEEFREFFRKITTPAIKGIKVAQLVRLPLPEELPPHESKK